MLPIVQQVASEYKASLQNHYGNELVELVLFGSHARGDYHDESDLDFAVILRNPDTRPATEIAETSPIDSRLSLKYGLIVSPLYTSFQKKETSMQGVYQEIRKEGIVI
ncbi:MAG TPA: nucleotidyltransferase domain-containing protein [Puia sp.]